MRTSDSQTHAVRCGWSCSEVDGVLQQLVGECCRLGRFEIFWGQIIGTNPPGKVAPKGGLNKYSRLHRICCWFRRVVCFFFRNPFFMMPESQDSGKEQKAQNRKVEYACIYGIYLENNWYSTYLHELRNIIQYTVGLNSRWCKAAKKGSKR